VHGVTLCHTLKQALKNILRQAKKLKKSIDETGWQCRTFEKATNTFLLGTFNWLCNNTRDAVNKSL